MNQIFDAGGLILTIPPPRDVRSGALELPGRSEQRARHLGQFGHFEVHHPVVRDGLCQRGLLVRQRRSQPQRQRCSTPQPRPPIARLFTKTHQCHQLTSWPWLWPLNPSLLRYRTHDCYFFLRKRTLVLLKSVADSTHIYIWLHTGNIALNLKSQYFRHLFLNTTRWSWNRWQWNKNDCYSTEPNVNFILFRAD